MNKLFLINGFWKNGDREVFKNFLVSSSSDDGDDNDNVFYYGLSEKQIKQAIKDGFNTDLEFVISSYKEYKP